MSIDTNMTCDIWRNGNLGNPPDVADVPCFLLADYDPVAHQANAMELIYDHTMMFEVGTDVRDSFQVGFPSGPDTVGIPAGGPPPSYDFLLETLFVVVFVENVAGLYLKAYLSRITPSWPIEWS